MWLEAYSCFIENDVYTSSLGTISLFTNAAIVRKNITFL